MATQYIHLRRPGDSSICVVCHQVYRVTGPNFPDDRMVVEYEVTGRCPHLKKGDTGTVLGLPVVLELELPSDIPTGREGDFI